MNFAIFVTGHYRLTSSIFTSNEKRKFEKAIKIISDKSFVLLKLQAHSFYKKELYFVCFQTSSDKKVLFQEVTVRFTPKQNVHVTVNVLYLYFIFPKIVRNMK